MILIIVVATTVAWRPVYYDLVYCSLKWSFPVLHVKSTLRDPWLLSAAAAPGAPVRQRPS